MGRARTHGQSSVGTPDPGAISLALIVTAVGELLAAPNQKESANG
jgi:dihydroxyacetone kinase